VLSVEAGLLKAIALLGQYHHQGAYFVGANVANFDLEMLRRSAMSVLGRALDDDELDLSTLRIIDVIEHDLVIEPSREQRPRRTLNELCRFYGVRPGAHNAVEDARAAVDVFIEQVVRNNEGQLALELVAPLDAEDDLAFG